MTLVDDKAVALIDGRRHHTLAIIERPLNHPLYCGDMHGGVSVGLLLVEFLDAEDVGEGLQALHSRVLERVSSLFTEGGTIYKKEHAAETLHFEQAIDQRNAGLGLPSTSGHSQQHLASPLGNGRFYSFDGGLLVVARREAVVKRLDLELLVRALLVTLE